MRPRRLLRKVRLGGGYVISTILLPPSELADLCDDEHEAQTPYQGFWDMDKMTIYISTSLNRKGQWEVFWHELLHAVNDLKDYDRELGNGRI